MAGYSRTPLAKKRVLRPGDEVAILDAPFGYLEKIDPAPEGTRLVPEAGPETAVAHLFTASKARLAEVLAHCRESMDPAAMLWMSWPKKASKLPSEITEDTVRELALPLGYVDVTVCAVDETWSGLKLVVRKELRSQRRHGGDGGTNGKRPRRQRHGRRRNARLTKARRLSRPRWPRAAPRSLPRR